MSKTFSSVTTWEAETYFISVTINGFKTLEEAKKFGRDSVKKLVWEGTHLVLVTDGNKIELQDDKIKVMELTPEAQKKVMIGDDEDFRERNIPRQTLAKMDEFKQGFSFLSYGVVHQNF